MLSMRFMLRRAVMRDCGFARSKMMPKRRSGDDTPPILAAISPLRDENNAAVGLSLPIEHLTGTKF